MAKGNSVARLFAGVNMRVESEVGTIREVVDEFGLGDDALALRLNI